jgi:hypothetical protein
LALLFVNGFRIRHLDELIFGSHDEVVVCCLVLLAVFVGTRICRLR